MHYTALYQPANLAKKPQLVLGIYRCTQSFLSAEKYGLTSQLRRAALSVPTNIAEGLFSETEYLLIVSRDLGYMPTEAAHQSLSELADLQKMLFSLRRTVQKEVPLPATYLKR
jgi:hypothetical protein